MVSSIAISPIYLSPGVPRRGFFLLTIQPYGDPAQGTGCREASECSVWLRMVSRV